MKALLLLLFGILLLFGCVDQTVDSSPNASQANSAGLGDSIVAVEKGEVKEGDVVYVDYVGSSESKVFDTSLKAEAEKAGLPLRPSYAPLSFTVGAGQMIKGFDAAVVGMKVGEEKTVDLPPEQAYGMPRSDLILKLPRGRFQQLAELKVGSQVVSPEGAQGVVTAFDNESITVDFNHFLAGKTLEFKIILREIKPA
ncbi:peptidylprolyl isomerase [Candidatus Micrarchaeota archaeon]|nr:peptidylprolyl isomerase [Candidatus Micrarchaeota archaeon]